MKITLLTISILLLSSTVVCPQETHEYPSTSGNAYLRFCSIVEHEDKDMTKEDFRYLLICLAYTEGVVDGALAQASMQPASTGKDHTPPFCPPSESDKGQWVRITLKYIRNHPEQSHEPTVYLMMWALKEAFPCATQTRNK